jgi:plasmid maintenance system antidote protein VapI
MQQKHPGFFLKEIIEKKGVSISKFARDAHIHHDNLKKLLNGEYEMTFNYAWKVSNATDVALEIWLERSRAYKESLSAEII